MRSRSVACFCSHACMSAGLFTAAGMSTSRKARRSSQYASYSETIPSKFASSIVADAAAGTQRMLNRSTSSSA